MHRATRDGSITELTRKTQRKSRGVAVAGPIHRGNLNLPMGFHRPPVKGTYSKLTTVRMIELCPVVPASRISVRQNSMRADDRVNFVAPNELYAATRTKREILVDDQRCA